jgi:zeaxanthin glucosyltransferase
MAVIGLVPLAEPGHINRTRVLARELSELGHRVTFITTPENVELFSARSLPFMVAKEVRGTSDSGVGFQIDFKPEILIVDSFLPTIAIWAWQQGVTVLNMSTVFPRRRDALVPPFATDLVPSNDTSVCARITAAWADEHAINMSQYAPLICPLAREAGLPDSWLDLHAARGIMVRFPDISLVPAELDFPRSRTAALFYAGPCVDLTRPEPAFSAAGFREEQPLVYASFGTQSHRYGDLKRELRILLDAARRSSELQFVIACSNPGDGDLPPNVIVVAEAPQLTLLRRASLMLSHGGANAVCEALCLGVPLVVLPFDTDQPGNAARVVHHGLGRRASWDNVTGATLADLIRDVIADSMIAARVNTLAGHLQAALSERRAARAFSECLKRYEQGQFEAIA